MDPPGRIRSPADRGLPLAHEVSRSPPLLESLRLQLGLVPVDEPQDTASVRGAGQG